MNHSKLLGITISLIATIAPASAQTTQPAATQAAWVHQDPLVPAPQVNGVWAKGANERHFKLVERARQGNISVLFLGDSITQMWETVPDLWRDRFEKPFNAANFGVGADGTQNVLYRITNGELDNIDPRLVVLLIGTNNIGPDKPEKIAQAVEKIIGVIREKCPHAKVLLMSVFPRNSDWDNPRTMPDVYELNECLAKIADGKEIRLLDIGNKFLGPDGKVPRELMRDGLHPTPKGYEIWADALTPVIKDMLGE